jgi:iron(III) transport system permease protein
MFLVFVSSASDFGIPAVLAIPAGFSTVTTLIYSDLSFAGGANAISSAASLSAVLGVIAIVLVVVTNRIGRVGSGTGRVGGRAFSSRPLISLGRFRAPVAVLCWVFLFLTTIVPFIGLLVTSVSPAFRMTIWPGDWVGTAYATALSGDNIAALGRSVILAAGAALVVAIGGAAVAVLLRRKGRLANASLALLSLPFALPGSVVAIAVLLAWQRWLYGTMLIILIAYVARFSVIGIRTSVATLGGLSEDLVEAARASGATSRRAAFDIVRPAMTPGMMISFALVFLLGIHELTMSSLLYGPSTKTFAVQVLAAEQAGEVALTAALAMLITAITVVVAGMVFIMRSSRRIVSSEFTL